MELYAVHHSSNGLILLTVHIRKSGSQDSSTATTTGEALHKLCTCYIN